MFCIFCANSVFTEIEVEQLKLPGMLFTRFLRRTVWTVLRFSQNICWFWPVLRLKGRTKTYCYKKFYRTVARWCSVKKLLLEISRNSQENTCVRVSFLIKLHEACNFIKKKTLVQVFSCEFQKTSKNTFLFLQNTSGRLLLNKITSG